MEVFVSLSSSRKSQSLLAEDQLTAPGSAAAAAVAATASGTSDDNGVLIQPATTANTVVGSK